MEDKWYYLIFLFTSLIIWFYKIIIFACYMSYASEVLRILFIISFCILTFCYILISSILIRCNIEFINEFMDMIKKRIEDKKWRIALKVIFSVFGIFELIIVILFYLEVELKNVRVKQNI